MSAGYAHTCIVTMDMSVFCVGEDVKEQGVLDVPDGLESKVQII